MFDRVETDIPGCFLLRVHRFEDERGILVKTFHSGVFRDLGLEVEMVETFWSFSHKGVLRGLHYQRSPYDCAKLVSCLGGAIFDAIVDLRPSSAAFGHHATFRLTPEEAQVLYLPRGVAHGFQALANNSIVLYQTTSVRCPEAESGVRWDTCGIAWPDLPNLSARDKALPSLEEYMKRPTFP